MQQPPKALLSRLARTSGRSFLKRMLQRNAVSRLSRLGLLVSIRTCHSGPRFFSCGISVVRSVDGCKAAQNLFNQAASRWRTCWSAIALPGRLPKRL